MGALLDDTDHKFYLIEASGSEPAGAGTLK